MKPGTATSSAADDAIRRVIDQRRRRNAGLVEPQPQASALGGAIESVTSAIGGSVQQLGLPQWLFRAAVLGAVALVLGGAVVGIAMRAPSLHTVAGVVVFGMLPVPQARISFHQVGPAAGDAQPLTLTTDKDGSFRTADEPNISAGLYAVTIDAVPRGVKGLPAIPVLYRDPATTPLRVHVAENLTGLKLMIRR